MQSARGLRLQRHEKTRASAEQRLRPTLPSPSSPWAVRKPGWYMVLENLSRPAVCEVLVFSGGLFLIVLALKDYLADLLDA